MIWRESRHCTAGVFDANLLWSETSLVTKRDRYPAAHFNLYIFQLLKSFISPEYLSSSCESHLETSVMARPTIAGNSISLPRPLLWSLPVVFLLLFTWFQGLWKPADVISISRNIEESVISHVSVEKYFDCWQCLMENSCISITRESRSFMIPHLSLTLCFESRSRKTSLYHVLRSQV